MSKPMQLHFVSPICVIDHLTPLGRLMPLPLDPMSICAHSLRATLRTLLAYLKVLATEKPLAHLTFNTQAHTRTRTSTHAQACMSTYTHPPTSPGSLLGRLPVHCAHAAARAPWRAAATPRRPCLHFWRARCILRGRRQGQGRMCSRAAAGARSCGSGRCSRQCWLGSCSS